MSLLPLLLADHFDSARPSRLHSQHFGLGLDDDDLLAPLTFPRERSWLRCPAGYYRPWQPVAAQKDNGSTITFDKDKYEVHLDVQQFHPEEITVKITGDNTVQIEGKHEEKPDEHGFISRHFIRKYVLPEGHDVNQIVSNLSSDGVLTITAPKVDKDKEGQEIRTIPIKQTGQPLKPTGAKPKGEEKEKK